MISNDDGKPVNVSVARTILSVFNPLENDIHLFATHINGNSYNNKLSNLQWSACNKLRDNLIVKSIK